jgi:hypothetical protein
MISSLHPLAVPFPPLQRVGMFAAGSVRALADFAALNAAARECVTQMGVRDRALPSALRADIARGADRAAIKCAWECEALADALVPAAQQLGINAAAQIELLIAFRDVGNMPASWSLATPLAQWDGVGLSAQGDVVKTDLRGKDLTGHVDLTTLLASLTGLYLNENQLTGPVDLTRLPASLAELYLHVNKLTGAVDLTQLPASLTELCLEHNQLSGTIDLTKLPEALTILFLDQNQLSGAVDLTKLPATLTSLFLAHNAGLTGKWRGTKPSSYDFDGTGIKETDA